jgi:hypothetical protein
LYFKFLCNYFLKFVVHEINSKMVKSGTMVLTRRVNANLTDADVVMGWMLQTDEAVMSERES